MLLDAKNCQGYSFYRFRVIKGKPRGGGKITSTQIRVKKFKLAYCSSKLIYLIDVEKHEKTVQKQ